MKLIVLRTLGRSGSLFMNHLWDGHPTVLAIPAVLPFYNSWGSYHSVHWSSDWRDFFHYLESHSHLPHLYEGSEPGVYRCEPASGRAFQFSRDVFFRELERTMPEDPTRRDFLIQLHLAYARTVSRSVEGITHIFLHEHNGYGYEEIQEDFPGAHTLLMARDPRNSYASFLKQESEASGWKRRYYLALDLGEWKDTLVNAELATRSGMKIHTVKTESLNRDPEAQMKRLCQKLGVPFDPALLAPTLNGHPALGISVFNRSQKGFDSSVSTRRNYSAISRSTLSAICRLYSEQSELYPEIAPARDPLPLAVLKQIFRPVIAYNLLKELRRRPRALPLIPRVTLLARKLIPTYRFSRSRVPAHA